MEERRRFSREHYEIRGSNLYQEGNWLPIPQTVIRFVVLQRASHGLWAPPYPAREPVKIGDDVALEIIAEARTRKLDIDIATA